MYSLQCRSLFTVQCRPVLSVAGVVLASSVLLERNSAVYVNVFCSAVLGVGGVVDLGAALIVGQTMDCTNS